MASIGAGDPGLAITYEDKGATVRRPATWHRELADVPEVGPVRGPDPQESVWRRDGEDRAVSRPRWPAGQVVNSRAVGSNQVIATITQSRRWAVLAGIIQALSGDHMGPSPWSGIRPLRGLPSAAKTWNDEVPGRETV